MRFSQRIAIAFRFSCVFAVFCIAACSGAADEKPEESTGPQVYKVRGIVVALPDPADPTSEFRVAHEAIPNFRGAGGNAVGMEAMTMDFPLAPGASLRRIAVGDKVELTMEVDWDSETPMRVTMVRELLSETQLDVEVPESGGRD